MTHDPLCPALEGEGLFVAYAGPVGGSDNIDCLTCYIVALVREDERSKNPIAIGVEIARKARERALADAVEAVKDRRVPWPTATGDLVNEGIDDAVAAIEALGGER